MPTAEEFDEFYVNTRRRVVLQTFAVTGDLSASRTAVRDAYVAARHHWSKVGRMDDPEQWVRPRAWTIAQRRHSTRPWHKEKSLAADQAELLEALQRLTDPQRKTLVLTHLAAVPMSDVGREIGETQERAEQHLQQATAATALALDGDSTSIRARLESLGPLADTVRLPRAAIVRRNGLRRRRNYAVVGSALAVLITVGAGALVQPQSARPAPPRPTALVSKKMLLTGEQVAPLAPKQPWQVTGTTDNTADQWKNTMCQAARFADKRGLGTWVRTFATTAPARSLVQTVEISNSPGAAKNTYDTTLGWYAGCTIPRIQLVDAYVVHGVGEQAQVLRMRIPGQHPQAFLVGIARTGALTTSSVLQTHAPDPADPRPMVDALSASVQDLCASKVAGTCLGSVTTEASLPPPSGETAGMLAIADLPAVADVTQPWAGTDPTPARVNIAATTCDDADFTKAGASKPVTRTYLIPNAGLPDRFGLSETLGQFSSQQAASGFAAQIAKRMKSCPDRELASKVTQSVVHLDPSGGASYALWRLENQVNKKEDVVPFWMGVVQVGSYVAQVNLSPVGKYDVDRKAFEALVVRARDRLHEVAG